MKQSMTILVLATIVLCVVSVAVVMADKAAEKRAQIRQATKETLARLYKVQPSARNAVASAVGYGVFRNFGMKIFVAGGGSGSGLVVHRQTGKETFMKMVEVQAGLGIGVKKFAVIFLFETDEALKGFVEQGWEFGGQATAAAKYKEEGGSLQGAISVSPGVWMYQLTEAGLAAEMTAKGTKYFKDTKLNP
jgi:lipid-binding SYLF domain-containing protein